MSTEAFESFLEHSRENTKYANKIMKIYLRFIGETGDGKLRTISSRFTNRRISDGVPLKFILVEFPVIVKVLDTHTISAYSYWEVELSNEKVVFLRSDIAEDNIKFQKNHSFDEPYYVIKCLSRCYQDDKESDMWYADMTYQGFPDLVEKRVLDDYILEIYNQYHGITCNNPTNALSVALRASRSSTSSSGRKKRNRKHPKKPEIMVGENLNRNTKRARKYKRKSKGVKLNPIVSPEMAASLLANLHNIKPTNHD